MNVQNTIKYGMRNVVANADLQRFSFEISNKIRDRVFADINDEVFWLYRLLSYPDKFKNGCKYNNYRYKNRDNFYLNFVER